MKLSSIRNFIINSLCMHLEFAIISVFLMYGKPFERGFFCNDESISYPWNKKSTVTTKMLLVIGIGLPIGIILIEEYFRSILSGSSSLTIFGCKIPQWLVHSCSMVESFVFGGATTVLTTYVIKFQIGRLRPHFMQVCAPSVDCRNIKNQYIFMQDFNCTNELASPFDLKEAKLSFPSGHASFSAYSMIFLVLYMQFRCRHKTSKLLRPILQIICILMTFYTGLSRVSDYMHHWSDVLTGFAIGTSIAVFVIFGVPDFDASEDLQEDKNKEHTRHTDRSIAL